MSSTSFDMPSGLGAPPTQGWGGKEHEVIARFYRGQKNSLAASGEAGIPVAIAVDMIEIRQFGEKDSTIHEVTEMDKRRFPSAWRAYEAGMEQVQDGTPLDVLFPKNPEVVTNLKASHIWTVQALAGVPDSVTNIPFIFDHKKRAREFLEGVEKGKGFHAAEQRAEAAELKQMELEELVKAQAERLTALEKKLPKTEKE